jgi:hypothetical protein
MMAAPGPAARPKVPHRKISGESEIARISIHLPVGIDYSLQHRLLLLSESE